jgi:hypothetical protein
MKAPVCPMCGNDRWLERSMGPYVIIWIAFLRRVPVRCRVCLACGFVATYVDDNGLAKFRAAAKREECG